jgi:acyl transferase domain-containing protein
VAQAAAQAAAVWGDRSERLERLLWPPAAAHADAHETQMRRLAATDIAQPAIAGLATGMLDLAGRVGLVPARVAGHSFGELIAAHAAGIIDRAALLHMAAVRGRIMAERGVVEDGDGGRDVGALAVVHVPRATLAPYLVPFADVTVAHINAPDQCVMSGSAWGVAQITHALQTDGYRVQPLPAAAACHSPLMQAARGPFGQFLADEIEIRAPRLPVHGSLDGTPYSSSVAKIRRRWIDHLENCVDFVAQVEQMAAAGVRTFVELGPGGELTGFVDRILQDRPHRALAAGGQGSAGEGELAAWLATVAELYAGGLPLHVDALLRGRAVRWIDLDHAPEEGAPAAPWLLDGSGVWAAGAERPGRQPAPVVVRPASAPPVEPNPTPAVFSVPPVVALPPVQTEAVSAIYREYQQTMRQFLAQQERLIAQLLEREEQKASNGVQDPVQWSSSASASSHVQSQATPPEQLPPAVLRNGVPLE